MTGLTWVNLDLDLDRSIPNPHPTHLTHQTLILT